MHQIKKKGTRFFGGILILAGCLVGAAVFELSGMAAASQQNSVTDKSRFQRIVSLVPAATEILFEIGATDEVVALTYHDGILKGALDKAIVGGFFSPSPDRINRAKPDMIILSPLHKNIIETVKGTDCKIFIYETGSIEKSYENILALGKIGDQEDAAKKLIEKNRKEIDHIQKKLFQGVPGRRKRVIRLMGRDSVMTPGNTSFQNELIRLAGGIPPDFGKQGQVVKVTKEQWLAFNPEVIYGCTGDKKAAETFFSQPGWKDVDAVKLGQIFYFPCELTCRAASHSGYFVSWLSSMIYMDEFSKSENNLLPVRTTHERLIDIDLDYVKAAAIRYSTVYDFENKTLVIDFKKEQTILSTLEGERHHILTVGNHYSPAPTWGPGHQLGIDHIRSSILSAVGKQEQTASFLMTGADMDNLSVTEKTFKDMKVMALVTAGVMSNAVRMSKDMGAFYEPGTINIILMTTMHLSKRAMARAIIAATEAKTAALEDMDIRSTYTPLIHGATGTGTDNVIVVQGEGLPIDNAGGHSKMGELVGKAVYDGVKNAVLNQNHITAGRHIFQRLKERKISVFDLTSGVTCDCMNLASIPKHKFAAQVEHLLLDPGVAGFLEASLALSDAYEKGLVNDISLFAEWCRVVAGSIAGKKMSVIQDLMTDDTIPFILRTALNAIFTGALEKLSHEEN
ncbi:MAG: adenosylcobinamide amidohydrolase [Proteobacteria bacterium]|nr:adenosylcobinamide amidohydrolase [Pseudomonadota bacterium]MBU1581190.1 adenosylcobinamide amidohydrolase [Pseudomonadota bacterium]MBU2455576.1 adenosylcobinamide amidohydrolase [Pseudomonadota bacterium]